MFVLEICSKSTSIDCFKETASLVCFSKLSLDCLKFSNCCFNKLTSCDWETVLLLSVCNSFSLTLALPFAVKYCSFKSGIFSTSVWRVKRFFSKSWIFSLFLSASILSNFKLSSIALNLETASSRSASIRL